MYLHGLLTVAYWSMIITEDSAVQPYSPPWTVLEFRLAKCEWCACIHSGTSRIHVCMEYLLSKTITEIGEVLCETSVCLRLRQHSVADLAILLYTFFHSSEHVLTTHSVLAKKHSSVMVVLLRVIHVSWGARGSIVVKALCHKPEGRGFDCRWGKFLNLPNIYLRPHYALEFTQPLTEISTRNIKIIMFLGSKVRPVRRADNFTAICEPIV
jgi:hypothetical protein